MPTVDSDTALAEALIRVGTAGDTMTTNVITSVSSSTGRVRPLPLPTIMEMKLVLCNTSVNQLHQM
jgi:phage baseplate assembly protein gpV